VSVAGSSAGHADALLPVQNARSSRREHWRFYSSRVPLCTLARPAVRSGQSARNEKVARERCPSVKLSSLSSDRPLPDVEHARQRWSLRCRPAPSATPNARRTCVSRQAPRNVPSTQLPRSSRHLLGVTDPSVGTRTRREDTSLHTVADCGGIAFTMLATRASDRSSDARATRPRAAQRPVTFFEK
jgi:hypothetical protein